jgi:hypothetical protein
MSPGGQIYVTAQNAIDIWSSLGKIQTREAAADIVNNSFVMAK